MKGTHQSIVCFPVVVKALCLCYGIVETDLCKTVGLYRSVSFLSENAVPTPY
jgi:hypothetical protein